MTAQDWLPIAQAAIAAVIGGLGIVFTALLGIFVPRAIAAFEARTHIAMTDQERAAVLAAIQTAAGLLQNKLDTGLLKARDITPKNSIVMAEADKALASVPVSAASQGTTLATASAMIAARVDTAPKPVVPSTY